MQRFWLHVRSCRHFRAFSPFEEHYCSPHHDGGVLQMASSELHIHRLQCCDSPSSVNCLQYLIKAVWSWRLAKKSAPLRSGISPWRQGKQWERISKNNGRTGRLRGVYVVVVSDVSEKTWLPCGQPTWPAWPEERGPPKERPRNKGAPRVRSFFREATARRRLDCLSRSDSVRDSSGT